MLIDCDTCRARDTGCSDCVISLLLGAPDGRTELSEPETAAFAALADGGILPPLRMVPVLNIRPLAGAKANTRAAGQGEQAHAPCELDGLSCRPMVS